MNRIIDFFMKFYGIKNSQVKDPDIIVPLSYGLFSPTILPDVEIGVLEETVCLSGMFPRSRIIFSNSSYFWGSGEPERNLKLSFLMRYGISVQRVKIVDGITNSLEEATEIWKTIRQLPHNRIVIVADWMHARSVRCIWGTLFPRNIHIDVISERGSWSATPGPFFFLKSDWRWLAVNLLRHIMFLAFGERIARFHH